MTSRMKDIYFQACVTSCSRTADSNFTTLWQVDAPLSTKS